MTLRNICRCEFLKFSIFPGSVVYHMSNPGKKINHASENSNSFFFRKALFFPVGKLVNTREVRESLIKNNSSELWLGVCSWPAHLCISGRSSLHVDHENTLNG